MARLVRLLIDPRSLTACHDNAAGPEVFLPSSAGPLSASAGLGVHGYPHDRRSDAEKRSDSTGGMTSGFILILPPPWKGTILSRNRLYGGGAGQEQGHDIRAIPWTDA